MNIGPILRAMKHNRTRVVLLVLEIAMTLAIVTNCVNVIIAERAKMARPSGFDDDNILWMRSRPFAEEFRDNAYLENNIEADLQAIRSVPGVRAVANSHMLLWEGGGSGTQIKAAGAPGTPHPTQRYYATKDIFDSIGMKVVEGRGFTDSDYPAAGVEQEPRVAVISRTVAKTLFPDGQALGKSIVQATDSGAPEGEPLTVVGLVDTFFNPYGFNPDSWRGMADRVIFMPSRIGSFGNGTRFLIRTEPGAMPAVMAELEKRLPAANPGRVLEFKPTPEKKSQWFSTARLTIGVMTGLIIALVFVTGLGILGITALAVSERTKQIGTRRALGATRTDILRHFMLENWLTTTAGIVLGVVAAYALNFLLVSQVTDVKMPWQLIATGMVLLWLNGLLATLPPALRAMNVPPSIATRSV
ncbi:MAG TPA: FtsX-like permease family protein [Thermoanaerobaculia bacterium]|nr:FtsX-like permease family protein [Thermoanaerobaculia bacterium]